MVANALVTLLALLLSIGASRGEGIWVPCKVGTLEWSCQKIENTETCKIKPKDRGRIQGEVTIPSEVAIEGKTLKVVTVAEEAFLDCKDLSKVTIPEGVETIEECAFASCEKLPSLQLPQGLKVIGEQAFAWCYALSSVNIPANVESIGYDAFQNCNALKKFEVAAGNGHFSAEGGVLFNYDKTALLCYPLGLSAESYDIPTTVKSIGACAFYGNGKLKTVNIQDGVTAIGQSAFSGCSVLEKVVVPKGVTTIEPYTFYGCKKLSSVELHEGLKTIDADAFENCTLLERVELPKGLDSIEDFAFTACEKLSDAAFSSGLKKIGESAFAGTMLKTVALPEGLTSIGGYAFSGCESLERVELPEGLTSIGENAFFAFSSKLREATIPTSVTEIGSGAFSSTALTSVAIPAGVKELPGAFTYCKNLEKVTLSEGLEGLDGTFSGCEKLTEVTIPASVKSIADATFSGCTALNRVYYLAAADATVADNAFDGIANPATLIVRREDKAAIEAKAWVKNGKFTVVAEKNKVTFSTYGGLPVPDVQWVVYGENAKKPAKDPVKEGFKFEGWILNNVDYKFDIPVSEDIELQAKYVAEYTLTITSGANGSVKVTRDNAQGEELTSETKLHEGDMLFIAATPVADYELETLTVNGNNQANSSVFTVGKENVEVKATFKKKGGTTPPAVAEYTLTITSGANGSVKVTRDNAQGEELTSETKLHEGDMLFIAATPDDGYELETLTVNGAAHANSSVFTVGKANVEVKATFKAQGGATPPSAVESVLLAAARVVQNPIDNALVLEGISTAERIEVYSLTGTPTYSRALHGEERVEIATGSWASGIYVVRIIAADGEKTVRVVKR